MLKEEVFIIEKTVTNSNKDTQEIASGVCEIQEQIDTVDIFQKIDEKSKMQRKAIIKVQGSTRYCFPTDGEINFG